MGAGKGSGSGAGVSHPLSYDIGAFVGVLPWR